MTSIDDYQLSDPMVHDTILTGGLKSIGTRLSKFKAKTRGHLINWGYALCDAAMRKYVYKSVDFPKRAWPVADYPL